jgi:hypothetical protein
LNRTPAKAYHGFSFSSSSSSSSSSSIDNDNDVDNHNNDIHKDIDNSIPPQVPLTSIGKATVGPLVPFHDASPCTALPPRVAKGKTIQLFQLGYV